MSKTKSYEVGLKGYTFLVKAKTKVEAVKKFKANKWVRPCSRPCEVLNLKYSDKIVCMEIK